MNIRKLSYLRKKKNYIIVSLSQWFTSLGNYSIEIISEKRIQGGEYYHNHTDKDLRKIYCKIAIILCKCSHFTWQERPQVGKVPDNG